MENITIFVESYSNLAIIKYWGVFETEIGTLPTKSSTSLTLTSLQTLTKLTISSRQKDQKSLLKRFSLNGKEYNPDSTEWKNIEKFLDNISKIYGDVKEYSYEVESYNLFPTAAGLASSAAGFSALGYAVAKAVPELKELTERELTIISRQLSGSACRSIPKEGGFVVWYRGFPKEVIELREYYDKDLIVKASFAKSLISYKDLQEVRVILPFVSESKKHMDSRQAMSISMKTSPTYWKWIEYEETELLPELIKAMKNKDYSTAWKIAMKASDGLHAVMLNSSPSINYMVEASFKIKDLINNLNKEKEEIIAAYSFDAGPNPIIFTTEQYEEEIKNSLINKLGFEAKKIVTSKIGPGTREITEEEWNKKLNK